MINDKDINISEKPIAEEKAQASQEPPKQETPQQEPQQQEAPQASLKEVIAKQAIEEEASGSSSFTLRKILGGDILTAQIIRRQIWLVILIVFFCHYLHIQPIQYPERYHRVGQTAERTARHQIQSAVYKQPDNREES